VRTPEKNPIYVKNSKGGELMTLNLIFLTVTLKKKQWTNAEIWQDIEMEKRITENRRKLDEMGYFTHRL
jgi:uncharacterized protein (TIGR02413 family)